MARGGKRDFVVVHGFGETAQKYRADPAWSVREIPCGHNVPIDMPDQLTDLLIEAA